MTLCRAFAGLGRSDVLFCIFFWIGYDFFSRFLQCYWLCSVEVEFYIHPSCSYSELAPVLFDFALLIRYFVIFYV